MFSLEFSNSIWNYLESSITILPDNPPVPVDQSSAGITALANTSLAPPTPLGDNSQINRRKYQLHGIPGVQGYGFSVNSNQAGGITHKISQIASNSPAAQQGRCSARETCL